MSLDDLFLRTSFVDGQTRCHCGGELTRTTERMGDSTVTWGRCSTCGDGGALQIAGTDRASYPLLKPEAGK